MGRMLSLRRFRLRRLMTRQPIIFDLVKGRAYRADPRTISDTLRAVASKRTKPRVVTTVTGVPLEVLTPKK